MSIDNSEDIIDSRDVITRITELESDEERDEDENDELESLKLLAKAGEDVPDWEYGAALIRDSYFESYAQELAEDIGAISSDYSWPQSHIDWEAAADSLRIDYTSIDFDGVTYWGRA